MPQRIIYHGRVQGVGFRYTAASIARHYSITGYVRNLPDGTVEVVVDGHPTAVQPFLEKIAQTMHSQIDAIQVADCSQLEQFSGFEIR